MAKLIADFVPNSVFLSLSILLLANTVPVSFFIKILLLTHNYEIDGLRADIFHIYND